MGRQSTGFIKDVKPPSDDENEEEDAKADAKPTETKKDEVEKVE